MAATTFARGGTHTALVPQKWSKDDYKFAFEHDPLAAYYGTGQNALIRVNKNFLKEKGDKITFGMRGLLVGDGQGNDGAYSGNGEAQNYYDMSVEVAERGHSTPLNGNYTEQAAFKNLRPEMMSGMHEWVAQTRCSDVICALSGLTSKNHAFGRVSGANAVDVSSVQIATVNQVALTKGATASRWFGGGQNLSATPTVTRVASDSLINSTTNHLFGTAVISAVKLMAQSTINAAGDTLINPIRPITYKGEPYYLMLITLEQRKNLREDPRWREAVKDGLPRGAETNWLFTGADGVYDGVVIRSTDLLHRRTGAGGVLAKEYFDTTSDACASGFTVHRSLFLGANSACYAWAKMPVWKVGYSDPPHNSKYEVHTDLMYGVKKTVFNSIEQSIVVDTTVV